MKRYLRLLLCVPLLATTACAADAIAGPQPAPEPEPIAQAAPDPAPAEAPAAGASSPRVILCRLTLSPPVEEPLYIVDGVIYAGPRPELDAADIQSVEVIKGAAAASLYGSRAARGVILITTHEGAARERAARRRR